MGRAISQERMAIETRRALLQLGRSRAISAASVAPAVDRTVTVERSDARAVYQFPFKKPGKPGNPALKKGESPSHPLATVCERLKRALRFVCGAIFSAFSCVGSLRLTVLAVGVFLALIVTAAAVGGEIDLTKLLAGAEGSGHPRIVVLDGKLVNQGDGLAMNLEITKPRYRLVGNLAPSASIPIPAPDFTVQYETRTGDKLQRETRAFRTGETSMAGNRSTASAASSTSPIENGVLPPGLRASYDPAIRLLTVSADRPVEVRVDGFLLRPVSRTDKDGAQYRFSQANILVLGQDLKSGETTVFEVVFTKPQDFYSIPIWVREPGKPSVYFTVSVSTGGNS